MTDKSILEKHKDFSEKKITELISRVSEIKELKKHDDYCIFATGSFGRKEATEFSDIDLFFVTSGNKTDNLIPQLSKILIDAELIKLVDKMGFPPFSNDGEFLKIHYLDDIVNDLGSPKDDFHNFFTARLLLLLESVPIYNEDFYNNLVKKMIDTYYRDFHKHSKDFQPIFLVNDIIRYWKTLCLNYEHRRNGKTTSREKNLKTHIKNLKLVFSRKLTCYSFIIQIISKHKVLDENSIVEIVKMTPVERLNNLTVKNEELEPKISEILELYSWFINLNDKPEEQLLEYIADKEKRNEAFDKGRIDFGQKIFDLILALTKDSPEILKYLVI